MDRWDYERYAAMQADYIAESNWLVYRWDDTDEQNNFRCEAQSFVDDIDNYLLGNS